MLKSQKPLPTTSNPCFTTKADTASLNENLEEATNRTERNNSISPTSPSEINSIISKLASKKSPGHDLVTNKIFKNLTPKVLSYLASLFNSAMRIANFSSTWKHAILVPIHKTGKPANSLSATGLSASYQHYPKYTKGSC